MGGATRPTNRSAAGERPSPACPRGAPHSLPGVTARRLSRRRRATLQNNRDLWAALDLIREAIEWQSVGLLPNLEMVTPDPFRYAERIVRAIWRLGGTAREGLVGGDHKPVERAQPCSLKQ
jgi:hypothetical protein